MAEAPWAEESACHASMGDLHFSKSQAWTGQLSLKVRMKLSFID